MGGLIMSTNNATLYDLTNEQLEINAKVLAGELSADDVADHLEANKQMINDKILDYCRVQAKMASEQQAIETEIERLKVLLERKKGQQNQIATSLQNAMISLNLESFDVGLYRGKIHKGRHSVVIDDLETLSNEFLETKITFKPDKKAIKAAIDSGTLVAGARLEKGEDKLVIK